MASYIFGMVGDHARAEDIVQEVFISALRRLRQTDRPIAFKPWIYEIAKNACIDEFRRTRRAREVPLESPDERSDADRNLISSAPTPDAAVDRKQSIHHLQGAFRGLSENHHRIIVMREFEGLSYRQIGEKLGMTRPVVESTLFRARRKLGEEYDELVSGRRCQHVQTLIAGGEKRSLMKLGIRQRRQLARHLSHCQPCRRDARMAGLDESLFHAPGIAGKVAALLPLPWLRWRRSDGDQGASVTAGSHSIASLPSIQTIAQVAGIVAPSSGLGRATAAAAGLALAGIGGGAVVATARHDPHHARIHSAHVQQVGSTGKHRAPAKAGARASALARTARGGNARAAGAPARGAKGSTAGAGGTSHTTTTASSGSGGTSAPKAGSTHSSTGSSGSSPARHTVTSLVGIDVPKGGPVSGGSVQTPSVTAGKVTVPSVKVTLPRVPKIPAPTPSAGSQSGTTSPKGAVGGVVSGVKGTVRGVTGALPKIP
jgi:RNA polymerase sigma factor (sigma-70 family)